ncbi:MAG TPA: FGGY-family carbohydrate kinase, partial [Phycisphaeraceae bacterium]
FVTPGGILAKIDAFADATGQPCPATPGQYVRCCLESLALIYRITLDKLQALLDQQVDVLHIVGGGGKNELLNQMTADATGRQVVVGPYEATAIGNALTQFMGRGRIHGLDQLRAVVRASFPLQTYTPRNTAAYEEQLPRFRALLG